MCDEQVAAPRARPQRRRRSSVRGSALVEDVLELRAVAEAAELGSQCRAVAAVLRARDIGDVGLPAPRVGALGQPSPAAAPNGRWVLVAVVALLCDPGFEDARSP